LHGLQDDGVVYGQQNPAVIDAGVFHNDVIAVGNGEVLFYHEDAFLNTEQMLAELHGQAGGAWRQLPVDQRAPRSGQPWKMLCARTCSTASC
jgi:succinylarginine dihydrolase